MEYKLKKILNKVIEKNEELTEKDLQFIMECFQEKFGFSSGIALNPQLLLEDIEIGEATLVEEEEFDEWQNREILNVFDETESQVADIGLDFLCDKPKQCESFKANPYACRCIRENFDSPESFLKWRDNQIEDLSSKLTKLISKAK